MITRAIIEFSYLLSSFLFLQGLHDLSSTRNPRRGNYLLGFGLFLAIASTFLQEKMNNLGWILASIILGIVIGILSARKVRISNSPIILSFFNAVGGLSAAMISFLEFNYHPLILKGTILLNQQGVFSLLSILTGTVAFSGSVVNIFRYNRIFPESGISFPFQRILNFLVLLNSFIIAGFLLSKTEPDRHLLLLFTILSAIYGIFFCLPLSGVDSPIGISFLNSFAGLSTAFCGFIFENQILIFTGVLVGASGFIMTILLARNLKRSLGNVLLGGFQNVPMSKNESEDKNYAELRTEDLAVLLKYSRKILILPGYGVGAAQAHFFCKDLEETLKDFGVEVKYIIHPLAGRMPGHINILLSEAKVSYDSLIELEDANHEFNSTDVVLAIGANDIINPVLTDDSKNPLYGIPRLHLNEIQNLVVIKRSLHPGFANLNNPIFQDPKTHLILGNIKTTLIKLISDIKKN